MKEYICKWLLGADNTVEVMGMQVGFRWGLPGWVVAFILVGVGVYCYQLYKKEAPQLSRFYRWFLTVTRFITWVAVLLVVLRPHIVVDRLIEPKSNLIVLLDTSKSMTLVDREANEKYLLQVERVVKGDGVSKPASLSAGAKKELSKLDRRAVLEHVLGNQELGLLDALEEKYAVRFFAFDKDVREITPGRNEDDSIKLEMPEALGEITQLGQAIRDVAARLRGLPVTGILAFTDGASNKGEDPELAARRLGELNIPVFPVGIGVPEAADVKIVDVNIPDLIFKDDELAVKVTFEASSLEGVTMPVKLTLGEKEVGAGEVEGQDGVFAEEFVIRPKEVGDLVFNVTVPAQANEYFTENNSLEKRVRVIDNAIRILIVVDTPSWEYRYLKGFLNSDKRIETQVLIRRGDLRRAESDDEFIDRFPKYDILKKKVDCLIMNNIGSDYFSLEQMKDIAKYVSDDGGSLIMISATKGTPGSFVGTPVGDMMPVTLRSVEEDPSLDFSKAFTTGFKLRLTREGRYHVVPRLTPKLMDNVKHWETLPDQYWYYRGIEKLKPAAVSLVEHATRQNEYGPVPIISIQRYGRGQVLFLGINSIWRWRYKIGNKMTNRFWGQTIQFMGLPHLLGTIKRVQFETEGKDFLVGQSIALTARVLSRDFIPVSDESINLIATRRDDGDDVEFSFNKEAGKEGVFSGNLFLQEGVWSIQVQGYEEEETLILDVRPARYEYENPAMQAKVLDAVAQASGGKFARLHQIGEVVDWLTDAAKRTRSRLERDLWDTWFTLVLITLTTAIEWIFRKRKDMP